MEKLIMGFLIICLFYGVVVDAKKKGRNIPLWIMITLFTGGLGYLILLFLPSLKNKKTVNTNTTDIGEARKINRAHSFLSSLSVEVCERLEKYSKMTDDERRKVCIVCEGKNPKCTICATREENTKKYMSARSTLSMKEENYFIRDRPNTRLIDAEKKNKIDKALKFISSLSIEERERLEKYSKMTYEERRKACIVCEGKDLGCFSCASREEWTRKYIIAKADLPESEGNHLKRETTTPREEAMNEPLKGGTPLLVGSDLTKGISQKLLDRISSYRRQQKILAIVIFCSGFFWVWIWFLWVNKNVPHNPGGWLSYWVFFLLFTAMALGSLFYLPFRLVRSCRDDIEFFISLFPEEGPLICKNGNCNNLAVRNSTMCAKHHFEMVKHKSCPWEDKSKKITAANDSKVVNMASTSQVPCPTCQTSNPSTAKYCQSCGTPMLMPALICLQCNTSNTQSAKYCMSCGRSLAQIIQEIPVEVKKHRVPIEGPTKICPKCGETIEIEALICNYCGNQFGEEEVVSEKEKQKEIASQKEREAEIAKLKRSSAIYCGFGGPLFAIGCVISVVLCNILIHGIAKGSISKSEILGIIIGVLIICVSFIGPGWALLRKSNQLEKKIESTYKSKGENEVPFKFSKSYME